MVIRKNTDYITLVELIGQFRKGLGKFLTALDYYYDYCETRKIPMLADDFATVVANGTDDELFDWLTINVKNAVSYYD